MIAVALLVFMVLFVHFLLWPMAIPNNINADTYRQIEGGMTREKVVSLFGVPPGNYATKRVYYACATAPPYRPWLYNNPAQVWMSNEIQVRIHFDDDDRVEGCFEDWRIGKESTLERIRGWFSLQH